MELTKGQAIELHRKLWNFIADETERTTIVVSKHKAMEHLAECGEISIADAQYIKHDCFCCEYAKNQLTDEPHEYGDMCANCPVVWPYQEEYESYFCEEEDDTGLYAVWLNASREQNWKLAVKVARQIAKLPAKED